MIKSIQHWQLIFIGLTFLVAFNFPLMAQSTFQYTIGGEGNEQALDLIALPDGYGLIGFTSSQGSGSEDAYLIKLNNSYNLEWSKVIGSEHNDRGHNLIPSSDGGFLITGQTFPNGNDNASDMLMAKTDDKGVLSWISSNGGNQNEIGWGLVELPDNDLIVAGLSRSYGVTGNGAYLFKTNDTGDPQWGYIFDNTSIMGAPASDYFRDIVLCSTGEYVYMAGMAKRPGTCQLTNERHNWYMLIAKADLNGQLVWHTYVGGNTCNERAHGLTQTSDGHIVATGFTENFGAGGEDVYLAKVDGGDGELMWTRTYGGPGDERGNQVIETADGGLILTGWTDTYGAGSTDLLLLKTDDQGHLEWSRTYGGTGEEEGFSVLQTDDFGYLIAGYTTSYGNGGEDIFIIKTDEEGRLDHCEYGSPDLIEGTGGMTHTGLRISTGFEVAGLTARNDPGNDSINHVLCCPLADFDIEPGCIGDTLIINDLSAGDINSWLWDFGDGNLSDLPDPVHVYSQSGEYTMTLVVTDQSGCSDTIQNEVVIPENLTSRIEGDSTLCKGETIELTAFPDGAVYQWNTGNDQQTITVSPQESSEYSVIVSDPNACGTDTAFFSVQITELPTPEITGKHEVCTGESVKLSILNQTLDYTWSTGAMGESILIVPETDTTVFAIGKDGSGCVSDTAFFSLTVLPEKFNGMSNARDTILSSHLEDCSKAFVVFEAELDFCGLGTHMEDYAEWKLDIHNNGTFDFGSGDPRPDNSERNSLILEEYLPFGIHLLEWTFESPSGEIITEQHLITVVDNKQPTPVCLHGIAATIMPASGMITLPAHSWDWGSWDNCTEGGDLIFSFSSDPTHTHHTWTCDDLDGLKERNIPIEIWVTDESGHQDYCSTYLLLQDNQDGCPEIADLTYPVSGVVLNADDKPLNETNFTVMGGNYFHASYLNHADGSFLFELPEKNSYHISGHRSSHPLDGISTLDIVLIQSHILGIQPLENPWSRIAADVNSDSNINVLDLQILRSHLLGNLHPTQHFPQWKVIPESTLDGEREVPEYQTELETPPLEGDVDELVFRAVKMGDVNVSHRTPFSERSSGEEPTVEISLTDQHFEKGQLVKIVFKTEEVKNLLGLQASFNFDPDALEFYRYGSPTLPVQDHHFGFAELEDGSIYLSWNEANGLKVDPQDEWLELEFIARTDGTTSNHFFPGKGDFSNEIYSNNRNYRMEYIFKTSGMTEQKSFAGAAYPNPFNNHAVIPLSLPSSTYVELSIKDTGGKLVHTQRAYYDRGKHLLEITKENFRGGGVYFYQIRTEGELTGGKLIFIE